MTEYARYIAGHRVEKGAPFTHTSIGKPRSSYHISDEELPCFFENYRAALAAKEPLCMTEKHLDEGPVLIDLDFRFDDTEDVRRRYTVDDVDEMLRAYFRHAKAHVRVEGAEIYVMEKPGPRVEKGKLKDGVHVVVPNIITAPHVQLFLRQGALPVMQPLFERIGCTNPAEDVFDEAVIARNNWLMFGSGKPDQPCYEVTRAYTWCGDDLEPRDLLEDTAGYVELLSIRNKGLENVEWVSDASREEAQKHRAPARRPAVRQLTATGNVPEAMMFHDGDAAVVRNQHSTDAALAAKLVDVLSDARAGAYDTWTRVGWCLRNIDYSLLAKWVEFSRRSPKFVEGECEDLWDKMRVNGGLGMGSLKMWAAEDAPDRYREIIRDDIFGLVCRASTGTHYDIACIAKSMFGNRYVCASPRNRFWYEFRDHRWHPIEEGVGLSQAISVQVFSEFSYAASHFAQKAAMSEDSDVQKTNMDLNKKFTKVALRLKDSSFKGNVLKECAALFYVPRFEEVLDSKCHLIGFKNGVYDLTTMEFREGLPEDYISFSTGVDYLPVDRESEEFRGLMNYFRQVFPIEAVRDYVLLHMASCMNGAVREERFHIWTGVGSNSKSKVVELFERAYGDYCCKFPVTLLTARRAASNAATSEIARAKGRRFAVLQEPSENETFNVGLMKELSGGDRIIARSLYREPVEFKPQFKMVLTANHLPEVGADDDGTWRRIRVVEFIAKFTSKPDPTLEHQFPIDPDFGQKLESWKETFISYLIERYRDYMRDGLREPEEVLKCTREYQRNNDHITDFIESCTVNCENAHVTVAEANSMFRLWHQENNPDARMPSMKEMCKLMCKQWGPTTRVRSGALGWFNHKLSYSSPFGDSGGDGLDDV